MIIKNEKKVFLILGIVLVIMNISCSISSDHKRSLTTLHSDKNKNIKYKKLYSKISQSLVEFHSNRKKQELTLLQSCKLKGFKCSGDKILIDIGFYHLDDLVISKISKTGVIAVTTSKKYKRMSAKYSKLSELIELSKIKQVSIIKPEFGFEHHQGTLR